MNKTRRYSKASEAIMLEVYNKVLQQEVDTDLCMHLKEWHVDFECCDIELNTCTWIAFQLHRILKPGYTE